MLRGSAGNARFFFGGPFQWALEAGIQPCEEQACLTLPQRAGACMLGCLRTATIMGTRKFNHRCLHTATVLKTGRILPQRSQRSHRSEGNGDEGMGIALLSEGDAGVLADDHYGDGGEFNHSPESLPGPPRVLRDRDRVEHSEIGMKTMRGASVFDTAAACGKKLKVCGYAGLIFMPACRLSKN
ncbi:MAG: hypothetical protein JWR26_584 [Pedosphaera sp.]|nr:hypothetical protein [Pedosphaera sp.]